MKRSRRSQRGSALIVTLSLVIVMASAVAAAMLYSGMDQRNAAKAIHNETLQDYTEAALQYGQSFFTQNYNSWSVYLTYFETTHTQAQVQKDHPELFPTVPTGSEYTCYVYARDDMDELPPAVNNPGVDNNLRIFVGAVCTQNTADKGKTAATSELMAPLEYNPTQSQCQSQFSGGTQGLNNCGVAKGYR